MKAQYRVNPDMLLELEGADQKALFREMASAAEIFGCNWSQCGCCKDKNTKPRPVVRKNKKNQLFYELHCTNPSCRARFAFGQNQDSPTLFPQRTYPKSHAEAGKFKPNGGWVQWKPEDDEAA